VVCDRSTIPYETEITKKKIPLQNFLFRLLQKTRNEDANTGD